MNNDLKISHYKGNRCRLDISHPQFDLIKYHFSYNNPNASFSTKDNMPKRLYSISKSGMCDIGLILEIYKFIKEKQWGFKLNLSDKVKGQLVNSIPYDIIDIPNTEFKGRDYQIEAAEIAFKVGRGIQHLATSAGKTLLMAIMLESIFAHEKDMKCLIVVPNIGLVNQTFDDFKKYRCSFSFGKWSGKDELDDTNNVTIVNTGFLQTDLNNDNGKITKAEIYYPLFKSIKILIYDEVHVFTSDKYPKASKLLRCFEYDHTFGFTGSLPKHSFERDRIIGFFGSEIYTKTSKALRDDDYITNVEVKMVRFNHNDPYKIYSFKKGGGQHATKNYHNEIEHIFQSEFRNNNIKKIISSLKGNVLILVERIEQGELLKEKLEMEGKQVFFISGKMKVKDRKGIINIIEENENVVCIAMSVIFSKGISINNLPYLMFCYLGKAYAKTIQSVGRGLRLHERKNILIIFDLYDNLLYSKDHAEKRKIIYDDQQIKYGEFQVNE
jgi:superfamily II DNA or RNA helicase